jgi:glutaredoxin
MTINVYGRVNCQRCKSFTDKLKILNLDYEYRELDEYTRGEKGYAIELMVHVQMVTTDHIELPVVEIDDGFFGYSDGIKHIKEKLKNVQH